MTTDGERNAAARRPNHESLEHELRVSRDRLAAISAELETARHAVDQAEDRVRDSENRFHDLADLGPDAILIEVAGRFIFANRAAATLFGASDVDMVRDLSPSGILEAGSATDVFQTLAQAQSLLGSIDPLEIGVRRLDGGVVPVEAWAAAVTWHGHRGIQILLRDASSRKRTDESQKRRVAELQHQMRNTFAVLRSIARRTAETSETVDDYAMHLEGRINAFARVQAVAIRNPEAGIDLAHLVAEELLAYAAHKGDRVEISGPPLRLQPKAAESFALAVHELATNAVKHGALLGQAGRVQAKWWVETAEPTPNLVFAWVEKGHSPPSEKTQREGIETDLLERMLAYDLKARSTRRYGDGVLEWTIAIPINKRLLLDGTVTGQE